MTGQCAVEYSFCCVCLSITLNVTCTTCTNKSLSPTIISSSASVSSVAAAQCPVGGRRSAAPSLPSVATGTDATTNGPPATPRSPIII